jgi:heptosyltransferase-2
VTWIVEEKCCEVLAGNPMIDEVVLYDASSVAFLGAVKFDIAVNLDVTMESAALMSMVKARAKKGFGLDKRGVINAINTSAVQWLRMSLSDDLKKKNKDTYHDIIHDICGLERDEARPVLILSDEDKVWAASFAKDRGIGGGKKVIGINVGGAGRWRFKSPDSSKWAEIVALISSEAGVDVLLLGGEKEERKYKEILAACPGRAVDTGTNNTFGRFAALVGLCDVLVTPDTLAMHVGTALEKKIVALFGPTSSPEIELYGSGRKISPGMDCVSCYRKSCDKNPNCMDLIDVRETVMAAKELANG